MTEKVYVVTDLGPGDGGKGGVVHKIATMMRAHTVIKRGGAQGSHGVHTSRGESFNFSQWGCGTTEGIPTHLSNQMIVSPEGLLNEAEALRYQLGIDDPFGLLTVDETALVATPYDGIASRIKELARGDMPRGTVGTGVGQAYRRFMRHPDTAILVGDLKSPNLDEILAANQELVQAELQYIIEYDFEAQDRATVAEEVHMLYSDHFFDYVLERFTEASRRVRTVSAEFMGDEILRRKGVAVVETSHGVLTDRLWGFHPHVSAIRTLPEFASNLLIDAGYDEQIVQIGVTRAYGIRHGAGPMPTDVPEMVEELLPGSSKDENRYQGKVRVGPIDFVLLRYALAVCGGPKTFDGLAVTWFDQIQENRQWNVCDSYEGADDINYFSSEGEIRLVNPPSSQHQMALGEQLSRCLPVVQTIPVSQKSVDDPYDICAGVVEQALQVPVRMVSFGPTEADKICK